MKQRWRHLIASALALALCLSAAACGKSDDTAGDDWRASGAVVDSGTITHDGDSVDVLVTVSESSAAFYRDMPEQVLFDSVSFPVISTATARATCLCASCTRAATRPR